MKKWRGGQRYEIERIKSKHSSETKTHYYCTHARPSEALRLSVVAAAAAFSIYLRRQYLITSRLVRESFQFSSRVATMSSSYKLTYFNLTGLAEPIRFLLSYLNIEFEDVRFEREQWPTIKPTMPMGKVPTLEIDGKVLNQSMAICRYLAKKAGLAGADEWESLLIDIAVDNITDLRMALAGYAFDSNEESKAAKYGPLINETIPLYLGKFETAVAENKGYFVNGKLSWADILFVAISDVFNFMAKIDILEGRPNLQQLKKTVLAVPRIKSWIEKRPVTTM